MEIQSNRQQKKKKKQPHTKKIIAFKPVTKTTKELTKENKIKKQKTTKQM